jgi:hypothetical protein
MSCSNDNQMSFNFLKKGENTMKKLSYLFFISAIAVLPLFANDDPKEKEEVVTIEEVQKVDDEIASQDEVASEEEKEEQIVG